MKYRLQSLVLVPLALLFFAGSASLAATTELPEQTTNATPSSLSPYPGMVCGNADCSIRWDEELELKSQEEIDEKLREQFGGDWRVGRGWENLKVYYTLADGAEKAHSTCVCNCAMMLHFARLRAEMEHPYEFYPLEYLWSNCAVIQLLKYALPPTTDYLKDFFLNDEALEYLSPRFAIAVHPSQPKIQLEAEKNGISWKEFIPDLRVEEMEKNWTVVAGDYTHIHLVESARGDFNHDGFQDMLVSVTPTIDDGHWHEHYFHLITRRSPTGKTEILETIYYGYDVNKFK